MANEDYEIEVFNKHYETFDPELEDCEAYVRFKDGRKYVVTLFTLKGIQRYMNEDRRTGKSANSTYFWYSDLLIIEKVDEEHFRRVVEDLISSDEFEQVFTLCEPDLEEENQ